MSDLRSLLKEVVDEPAGTDAELDAIRRRSSRRAARQRWVAALVAIGVAVLGIGAATLMFGGHTVTPAARTTKPSAIPSPPGSPLAAAPANPCTARQLSGKADTALVQAGMQSLAGTITVFNHSSEPCLLAGRPVVGMFGPKGPLSVKITTIAPPGATGSGGIVLQPGRGAVVGLRWSNWCGPTVRLSRVGFVLRIRPRERAFVVGLQSEGASPVWPDLAMTWPRRTLSPSLTSISLVSA